MNDHRKKEIESLRTAYHNNSVKKGDLWRKDRALALRYKAVCQGLEDAINELYNITNIEDQEVK